MGMCVSGPRYCSSIPQLPSDVLRHIGTFIDHECVGPLTESSFKNYTTLLMTLCFTAREIKEKLNAYFVSSLRNLTILTGLGYQSLGHGHGEITTFICRRPTILYLTEPIPVLLNDRVSRSLETKGIYLNLDLIGTEHDLLRGVREDFTITTDTTPGW